MVTLCACTQAGTPQFELGKANLEKWKCEFGSAKFWRADLKVRILWSAFEIPHLEWPFWATIWTGGWCMHCVLCRHRSWLVTYFFGHISPNI